jgi:hypothetical protein
MEVLGYHYATRRQRADDLFSIVPYFDIAEQDQIPFSDSHIEVAVFGDHGVNEETSFLNSSTVGRCWDELACGEICAYKHTASNKVTERRLILQVYTNVAPEYTVPVPVVSVTLLNDLTGGSYLQLDRDNKGEELDHEGRPGRRCDGNSSPDIHPVGSY